MGHKVIYADNGVQAVQLFVEHEPELVLIDADMPEMNGYEITRVIRQSYHDFSQWTPIIIMSNAIEEEAIIKGIEVGADDYLTKPVSAPGLRAKVHAMRRLITMRESLIDFGKQLRQANEKLLKANQLLEELSLKDPLTRLWNRRAFDEQFIRIYRTAMREGKMVSLIMVDIDHFKSFNEEYGYSTGDSCLQQIAGVLKRGVYRASDFCARHADKVFAVILADTPLIGAMHVADRLRMAVEALQIPHKQMLRGLVTVSMGVASARADKAFEYESLISAAQAALIEARQAGENCIIGAKVVGEEQAISYASPLPITSSGSSSKH